MSRVFHGSLLSSCSSFRDSAYQEQDQQNVEVSTMTLDDGTDLNGIDKIFEGIPLYQLSVMRRMHECCFRWFLSFSPVSCVDLKFHLDMHRLLQWFLTASWMWVILLEPVCNIYIYIYTWMCWIHVGRLMIFLVNIYMYTSRVYLDIHYILLMHTWASASGTYCTVVAAVFHCHLLTHE